ncbi:LysR family substrate-binding domain-containing protein [Pseudomonas viridiflava]|uniref:LysR family substrate-binding domain-containing protein n=1 Tax=Pseudomonas viridiflava TaxID=33069 RepID=UPI0023F9AE9A|nr:LysR family substrate-binding domain-containing protein [Pseudomonas viridiflava]
MVCHRLFDRSSIPDVAEDFRLHFPNWRLVISGKHSIVLVRDIKNGAVDAAFIELRTETRGLMVEIVHRAPPVVALPADNRLVKKRELGFSDLCRETMFWFKRRLDPGYYDHCQTFFDQSNFKPNITPEPPDHHSLLGLVAEGEALHLSRCLSNSAEFGQRYPHSPLGLRLGHAFQAIQSMPSNMLPNLAIHWK